MADVFGDPTQPAILLWHGMQADARAAVRPLAGLLAGHGASVVVPDWNSHASDGGRGDLLGSLDFTRRRADGGIVLVGWSMGGAAAAGLTLDATRHDVTLVHTVCLAGAFMIADPISGRLPAEQLSAAPVGGPFTLLHGSADDRVPLSASEEFGTELKQAGWSVDVTEFDADHGSIAGADYNPAAERYEPGHSPQAQRVAGEVAARIAATLHR